MSLNGLDTPAIQDAYQSAIAEAGGWFLVKYSSRDSVELLDRGKAGVNEARAAIAQYEDASPLYGLIIYRRRKVCIKYIPEGTSRLLQARTAVHFQDISERFAPYETLLEITTADGLNDTSLASSFPLHTASPSTSQSRLHEISEDGEDSGGAPRTRPAIQHASTGSIFGTQRYKMEKRVDQIMRTDRSTPSIHVTSDSSTTQTSPLSSTLSSPQKTSISQFLVREDSGQRSITSLGSHRSIGSMTDYASSDVSGKSVESQSSRAETPSSQVPTTPMSPTIQVEETSPPVRSEVTEIVAERPSYTAERLISTSSQQINRPNLSNESSSTEIRKYENDPYDLSRFDIKPKVKLGPRPIAAGEWTKRPTVASTAALPASYRSGPKKQELAQAKLQSSTTLRMAVPAAFPAPPPIPAAPEYNPRPLSRGSIKSLPSHKSTAMTSDKVRLMKAVELRKKQLRKSNPQQQAFVPPENEIVPEVPAVPQTQKVEAEKAAELGMDSVDNAPEDLIGSKKPDSGIEMGYERHEKPEEVSPPEGPQPEVPTEPAGRSAKEVKEPQQHSEQPRHQATYHQPSPKAVEQSREVQALQSTSDEPTISLDMLEDSPSPLARLQQEPTYNDPTLGRTAHMDGLGLTASQITSSGVGAAERTQFVSTNELPQVVQSRIETREELEKGAEDDTAQAPQSPRPQNKELAKRRRGFVEPLHIESHPEGDFNSDDEFLEELHSATFQDAKPITMARSPMAPTFARTASGTSAYSDSVRSVQIAQRYSSNALDSYGDSPQRLTPESGHPIPAQPMSSPIIPLTERADSSSSLKRTVSPSVSRRFQGYAEPPSRDPNPPTTSPTPDSMAQTTWRDRKTTVRGPPKGRRGSSNSIGRHSGRMSSHASSGQYSAQENDLAPVWNVQHEPASNRESVSVSARIVRPSLDADDHSQSSSSLQQSQLVINHKRASATPANLNKDLPPLQTTPTTPLPPTSSANSLPTASSGLSPVMTRASTEYRTLHSSSNRKSFARLRQQPTTSSTPNLEDFLSPPLQPTTSTASPAWPDENGSSRESSRTSRFFKRMSNLGNNKRRSGAQQTTTCDPSRSASQADASSPKGRNASLGPPDRSDMPPAVTVGNLNIQFPDSLLWKRRIVEIDEAGNLIFSVTNSLDIHKSAAKVFHMTDFRLPYTPDLDRQELPNSVMLDFIDGTTLQAACEDGMTHRQVLHVLETYWKAWAGVA